MSVKRLSVFTHPKQAHRKPLKTAHQYHIELFFTLEQTETHKMMSKCSFKQFRVQFHGYQINTQGIQMDEGKVAAVQNWPTPITVKEL